MREYSFEKLDVWKLSKSFTLSVYKLTEKFPNEEKFGLVSQLRRASVSVCTNLAEGTGRKSKKDQANFSQIAYSSLLEVLNLLILSNDLNFISDQELKTLRNDLEIISLKLSNLRRSQLNE